MFFWTYCFNVKKKVFCGEPYELVGRWSCVLPLILFCWIVRFHYIAYDDPEWIFDNAVVKQGISWDSFRWSLTGVVCSTWCPLTNLSFVLESQIFGTSAACSHFINLILHCLNTFLLYRLLVSAFERSWVATFVTLLFAIHPTNMESIVWVSERKGLLSTFFLLLMFLQYSCYQRTNSSKRLLAALCFYALSLASKPSVVTAPFILVLMDFWPCNRMQFNLRSFTASLSEKLPFVLLAIADAACISRVVKAEQSMAELSLASRFETAVIGCARYVSNIVWPTDLNASYFHPSTWPAPVAILSFSLLILITFLTVVVFRLDRAPLILWLMFLFSIGPVLQFVPVGHTYMADRFLYVPGIWLLLLAVRTLKVSLGKTIPRILVFAGGVALLSLLAIISTRQVETWRNSETVFANALEVDPDNTVAHETMAYIYAENGDQIHALAEIDRALMLSPSVHWIYADAARFNLIAGNVGKAIEYQRKAYELCKTPKEAGAYAWCLATYDGHRQPLEALRVARYVAAISPSALSFDLVAVTLAANGEFDKAEGLEHLILSKTEPAPLFLDHLASFSERKMITSELTTNAYSFYQSLH